MLQIDNENWSEPIEDEKSISYLPKRNPVDIQFNDISFSVPVGRKSHKLILKGVNGKFSSGQLTAILGPSGAGKTTLLNILAGYKCEGATGTIMINGHKRNADKFTKISRYIMQTDCVQPFLTVKESMVVAANLKLGSNESLENKIIMINEILDLLRLTGCKNTRAKELSGGERKRLSIALELINNPPVIFLDEPTTGLDDVACSQCVGLLKLLARGGRTVICALHTPSAKLFSIFDNVYIVSEGQCVYQGYGPAIVPFLENIGLVCPTTYNPADFMIEVCCREYGDFQNKMTSIVENGKVSLYFNKDEKKEEIEEVPTKLKLINTSNQIQRYDAMKDTGSTCLEQFRILLMRMWAQTWSNRILVVIKLLVYALAGLLIGYAYEGQGNDGSRTLYNFGFFYVSLIFLIYVSMIPFLMWFPSEIDKLKREYFNKWYGLGPYYLALTLSTLPLQAICTFIYFIITYLVTDQPREINRMIAYYSVCLLSSLVAESMGLMVGAILDIVNALFIGTFTKAPMILLGFYGFGSGSESIPKWISISMGFSYLRYSLEGIMCAMLKDRPLIPCPEEEDWCIYTDVGYFLRDMGMEKAVLWKDILGLIVFILVFRIVGFYLLKQRLSPNKYARAVNVVFKLVKAHMGP